MSLVVADACRRRRSFRCGGACRRCRTLHCVARGGTCRRCHLPLYMLVEDVVRFVVELVEVLVEDVNCRYRCLQKMSYA